MTDPPDPRQRPQQTFHPYNNNPRLNLRSKSHPLLRTFGAMSSRMSPAFRLPLRPPSVPRSVAPPTVKSEPSQRGPGSGSTRTQRPVSTSTTSRVQPGTSGKGSSSRQPSARHSQSRASTSRRAGSTRPGTGRSTLADLEVEGTWVRSVFEETGRGAGAAVGIAAYEKETGQSIRQARI